MHGGSLNADILVEHLFGSINKIKPVQNNPFEEITIKLENILKRESKFVQPTITPQLFSTRSLPKDFQKQRPFMHLSKHVFRSQ